MSLNLILQCVMDVIIVDTIKDNIEIKEKKLQNRKSQWF